MLLLVAAASGPPYDGTDAALWWPREGDRVAVVTWDRTSPVSALLPPLASLFSKSSHQLGNELACLLGTIELACAASESQDACHAFEELRGGILGLSDRFRHVSRGLREAALDQWTWCPAHQVLGKARQLGEEAAPTDMPPSQVALGDGLPLAIYVHEPLLANAVAGILLNGWEAGAERIVLEAGQAGGGIVLAVCDTGPGISEDLLPRVADPFETTKPPPHWGLGLTLAVSAAIQHGGSLTVASDGPDRGTRVELLLRVPARAARRAKARPGEP